MEAAARHESEYKVHRDTISDRRAASIDLGRAIVAFEKRWSVPRVTLTHLAARAARLDARPEPPARLAAVAWSEVRVSTLRRLAALLNDASDANTARGALRELARLAGCTLAPECFGELGAGEAWRAAR